MSSEKSASALVKKMKDEDIKFLDLRFTDPKGKMQHVTFHSDLVDEDLFKDGTMFDGSSISGWKDINESDMVLLPDASTAKMDPFYQQDTLAVFCDILEPDTGEAYNRDPRGTAKAAEAYMRSAKVGDEVYFGPEAEFFVFDDVRWDTSTNKTGYEIDSTELPQNTGTMYTGGNMGHRPGPKGGYFPVPPVDSLQDMRGEMLSVMEELQLRPEKHHHEVAPAQHELGMQFDTLLKMGDNMQLYKYIVHNVSGKTASRLSQATNMQVSLSLASTILAASLSTQKRLTLSLMPRPTLISVWFLALKRLLCLLTQAVTARLLFVFHGQHRAMVSALKSGSQIQRVTRTSHIQLCLWLDLTASKTKLIQAKPWTKTFTNCQLKKKC